MRILSLGFVLALAVSSPALAADAWENGGPKDPGWADSSVAITSQNIVEVSGDMEVPALVLLSRKPFVALDTAAAAKYVGAGGVPADPSLQPYLVRGVELQAEGATGGFTAERKGNAVWVIYSCLAATVPHAVHRALVLFLPAPPMQLYVSAVSVQ
jgi:hypothetical protein